MVNLFENNGSHVYIYLIYKMANLLKVAAIILVHTNVYIYIYIYIYIHTTFLNDSPYIYIYIYIYIYWPSGRVFANGPGD